MASIAHGAVIGPVRPACIPLGPAGVPRHGGRGQERCRAASCRWKTSSGRARRWRKPWPKRATTRPRRARGTKRRSCSAPRRLRLVADRHRPARPHRWSSPGRARARAAPGLTRAVLLRPAPRDGTNGAGTTAAPVRAEAAGRAAAPRRGGATGGRVGAARLRRCSPSPPPTPPGPRARRRGRVPAAARRSWAPRRPPVVPRANRTHAPPPWMSAGWDRGRHPGAGSDKAAASPGCRVRPHRPGRPPTRGTRPRCRAPVGGREPGPRPMRAGGRRAAIPRAGTGAEADTTDDGLKGRVHPAIYPSVSGAVPHRSSAARPCGPKR